MASAFPVLFWNFMIKDDKGNKISMDDYKAVSYTHLDVYKRQLLYKFVYHFCQYRFEKGSAKKGF